MHHRLPLVVGALLVLVLAAGCPGKKGPKTVPGPAETPAETTSQPATPPAETPEAPEKKQEVTEGFPEEKVTTEPETAPDLDALNRSGVLQIVHFDFDRYDLTDEARSVLQRNAAWLRDHPERTIRIEGHCDERGTIEYNLALGERRASAVRDYLVSLGVASSRIRIVSYGEERPVDPGHNEEAWRKNRRAEFVIES